MLIIVQVQLSVKMEWQTTAHKVALVTGWMELIHMNVVVELDTPQTQQTQNYVIVS